MTWEAHTGNYSVLAEIKRPFRLRKDFDPGNYAGLLSCNLIVISEQDFLIIALWANQEAYRAIGPGLFKDLGIHPESEGWIREISQKKDFWLKRFVRTAVQPAWLVTQLSVATAIYTNIDTVRGGLASFRDSPDCAIIGVTPQKMISSGDFPTIIELKIANSSEVNAHLRPRALRFEPMLKELVKRYHYDPIPNEAAAAPLAAEVPSESKIKPYEDGTLRFALRPEITGDFTGRLAVLAKNDWWASKDLNLTFPLSVWPNFGAKALGYAPRSDGKACLILCSLRCGVAMENGISIDIQLAKVPGVTIGNRLDYLEKNDGFDLAVEIPHTDPGDEFSQALGDDPHPLSAFSERVFILTLQSNEAMSKDSWRTTASALKLFVSPAKLSSHP